MRESTKRRTQTSTIALTSALVLAACGALEQTEESRDDDGPIKVGHLTPRSGFLGQLGAKDLAGTRFAVQEINKSGGLQGRKLNLTAEDSVDPGTAVQKATRLVEKEQVDVLFGEINSASGLAIAGIADRTKTLYFNTGWNSNEGRAKKCSRYVFHTDGNNTMYVSTVGKWAEKEAGRGKFSMLTADYAFGHDLRKETKRFLDGLDDAQLAGDELVPTGTTDYTTYIRKIRQQQPDAVFLNLAGEDQTTFLKQYTQEFGAPYEVTGGVMDTVQFWAAGTENLTGVWPTTYYHEIGTKANRDWVDRWRKAHDGVPPDNQAWQSYVSVKMWADAVRKADTLDTEKVVHTLRSGMKFDVLKERPATIRPADNQVMFDMYAVQVDEGEKDDHDIFDIAQSVPGKGQDLADIQIPANRVTCDLPKN